MGLHSDPIGWPLLPGTVTPAIPMAVWPWQEGFLPSFDWRDDDCALYEGQCDNLYRHVKGRSTWNK